MKFPNLTVVLQHVCNHTLEVVDVDLHNPSDLSCTIYYNDNSYCMISKQYIYDALTDLGYSSP